MNTKIKNIIRKANSEYSEGKFYTLTIDEMSIIQKILGLNFTKSELTDDIYDSIYYTAKQKWPNDKFFTELQAENSGYGKEIIHREPMGSMEELKEGDWNKWKVNHMSFLLSDKLDGCSIILTYKNGKLFSAATRGKGIKGKDILRHIVHISNIPKEINVNYDEFVVRGELVCPKTKIEEMLKEVSEIEDKEQKNGRNTIAGALNRKESNLAVFKRAHFVAYWNSLDHGFAINKLKDLGFEIPYNKIIDVNTTEQNLINEVTNRIKDSDYEIDGIILTQLDNPDSGLETGTINPKCSRKFKIGVYNNVAESVVKNITWQISKNGKLIPVLNIEPIELCGSTISNVTGHNYQNLVDKQCGIGSKVKIKRAGLVIPYLEEVLSTSSDLNLPVDTYVKGVDLYLNKLNDTVGIQKLFYFGKKLNIDQLGPANCEILYYLIQDLFSAIVNPITVCEIYNLVDSVFIDSIGENGKKIIESLKESKNSKHTECEFADATGAFGNGIGEKIVQNVFDKYNTLIVTKEQLQSVEGFEEKRITQYIKNLSNWINIRSRLINYGVTFKEKTNYIGRLSNKVICFSGIRDKELEEKLLLEGAVITDSFNKKVNVLIVKDINANSTKIQKAKEQQCQIIQIQTLDTLIGQISQED